MRAHTLTEQGMKPEDLSILRRSVENSEKVAWSISELLPDAFTISYDRRFLPPNLTGEDELDWLNEDEKLRLNQIWGAAYFNLFAFVEEFITLFTLNAANDASFVETDALRAYVRFSEEEIKHQQLFRKYLGKFQATFPGNCAFLDNARDVASVILSNTKLCVILTTYHLELITQDHYLQSIKTADATDEKVKEILRCHWLEESQHAKLDLVKLQELARDVDEDDFLSAMDEYFATVDALVELLRVQTEMNYASLRSCSEDVAKFDREENRQAFMHLQHRAVVDLFVTTGFHSRPFRKALGELCPKGLQRLDEKSVALSKRLAAPAPMLAAS